MDPFFFFFITEEAEKLRKINNFWKVTQYVKMDMELESSGTKWLLPKSYMNSGTRG